MTRCSQGVMGTSSPLATIALNMARSAIRDNPSASMSRFCQRTIWSEPLTLGCGASMGAEPFSGRNPFLSCADEVAIDTIIKNSVSHPRTVHLLSRESLAIFIICLFRKRPVENFPDLLRIPPPAQFSHGLSQEELQAGFFALFEILRRLGIRGDDFPDRVFHFALIGDRLQAFIPHDGLRVLPGFEHLAENFLRLAAHYLPVVYKVREMSQALRFYLYLLEIPAARAYEAQEVARQIIEQERHGLFGRRGRALLVHGREFGA